MSQDTVESQTIPLTQRAVCTLIKITVTFLYWCPSLPTCMHSSAFHIDLNVICR